MPIIGLIGYENMRLNKPSMLEKAIGNSTNYHDSILPQTIWEWLLLLFVVGVMTLSNIPGLSRLIVLGGLLFSWMFLIYFLFLRLRIQPEIVIYFVWIAWSIIGVINVMDSSIYLVQLQTIIQISVLMFVVAGITALRPSLSAVMLALALGGIIVAISSYYVGELQIGNEISQTKRAAGLTRNANLFSYHVLFVTIASLYFWGLKSTLLWRASLALVVVTSTLVTIYSASRSGFFGTIALLLLWFFFCQSKRAFKQPLITLSIIFFLIWGIYYTTDYAMSSTLLGKRFQYENLQRGSDFRLQMYVDGFHIIKNNPIFGVGLNNFRLFSSTGNYSHSDYIEVAANTGVVGFLLYFSIYVVLWRRLNRIRALTSHVHLLYTVGFLKAAIITILCHALSSANITSKVTWLFLAGAVGYSWSIEQALLQKKTND